jgi:hypothetical protein
MVKASALHIVIIIALVIGVLCAALIATAYYFNLEYQTKARYNHLQNNLFSGVNILLANNDSSYATSKKISLFNSDADSVMLKKIPWGIYSIGVSKAYIQKDTLYKVFSTANSIDSSKWGALYLIDEDRPFSLSGKTTIHGDAYIPKAGVQEAYIDNKAYEGDKRLIIGKRLISQKTLPPLNQTYLNQLQPYFSGSGKGGDFLPKTDTIRQSFLLPAFTVNFKKLVQTIQNQYISGNIIIQSDTTITIDASATLNNVLIFAKAIVVKSGFQGSCQLFATDSIYIENNCKFKYPSCIGILRYKSSVVNIPIKISINQNTIINGIVFNYEKNEKPIKPLIFLNNGVKVIGQVYSQGNLELKDNTEIDGSAFTSRFLYKNTFTTFENYLINTTINSSALSPYYLTSGMLPVAGNRKKILQWLEAN